MKEQNWSWPIAFTLVSISGMLTYLTATHEVPWWTLLVFLGAALFFLLGYLVPAPQQAAAMRTAQDGLKVFVSAFQALALANVGANPAVIVTPEPEKKP